MKYKNLMASVLLAFAGQSFASECIKNPNYKNVIVTSNIYKIDKKNQPGLETLTVAKTVFTKPWVNKMYESHHDVKASNSSENSMVIVIDIYTNSKGSEYGQVNKSVRYTLKSGESLDVKLDAFFCLMQKNEEINPIKATTSVIAYQHPEGSFQSYSEGSSYAYINYSNPNSKQSHA